MGDAVDDWDTEEYEVPVLKNEASKVANNWEDEDLTIMEQSAPPPIPSAAQIEAAKRKAEEEEVMLSKKLEFALQANETPEERKIREKKRVEEGEVKLAGELFDGVDSVSSSTNGTTKKVKEVTLTSGIAGAKLKTNVDHVNFAITVSTKLGDSTSFNITAFLKELMSRTKGSLNTESLTEIIDSLTAVRDAKKKTEEPQKVVAKKSKKAIKQEEKQHQDKYGFVEEDGRYDSYSNMEDDFM
mmetsp:Transcript_37070/g.37736  ORF Transcript_37070/g.37736 Transcript_37070/m.37736 type:complete len:242 (-) Transcript_37070:186-911(-)|eukprot:CAMPEP_0182424168 /NCGR_PEP_ID=MMETSP1167-20130531/10332_1 /TAXON_ID=2988 /ORGANISM="Mallomonas Sp, Strain CCMP3275" /LENGTH=241 /DNA_ID=CAMNT_0024603759 /DNA_START=93 /DNA_END=818 /DNA_ORIENTATION=-